MKILEELLYVGDSYGITIATELAIDTLFTENSEHTLPKPMNEYTCLYINVLTLVRNTLSQFNLQTLRNIDPGGVVRVVTKDIDSIQRLAKGKIKVVFYGSQFKHVINPKAAPYVRVPTTKKQILLNDLQFTAYKYIMREDYVVDYPGPLMLSFGRNIVLSHIFVDVISRANTLLLESHTGALKTIDTWYTKYIPIKNADMKYIPPIPKMLLIFGTHDLYVPFKKIRDAVYSIAFKNKWNVTTSEKAVLLYLATNQSIYNTYIEIPNPLN